MSKKLFVLVNNAGDGSYHPVYTFNKEWIDSMEERAENDELDPESDVGFDGDGFHYDTLLVPDDTTLESLGIDTDCAEEY